MYRRERRLATRDLNRHVRPFEWGAQYVINNLNGDDPRRALEQFARDATAHSREFYHTPSPVGDYELNGDELTWTSHIETETPENNRARARFFPAASAKTDKHAAHERKRRAVVVLPQWNASANSHVDLCRFFNRFGISALRMTLPYHEARRPPEMERAEYLVSSNVGRTIQSVRQAVLDTRAGVAWLKEHAGFERVGIVGTSIGSCVAFLAFAHDANINVGAFNHVSGSFADVVWQGISTRHVRDGFGDAVTLEELRELWSPISPVAVMRRLLEMPARPLRFITARYDLTFPFELSRDVIKRVRELEIPLDVVYLPCGHYTSGERPWVYYDGYKIVSYIRKHL